MASEKDQVVLYLRGLCVSSKDLISLAQLRTDYCEMIGEDIPFQKLGYKNLEDLIKSADTLHLVTKDGKLFVRATVTQQSAHISSMVQKQKTSTTGKRRRRNERRFDPISHQRRGTRVNQTVSQAQARIPQGETRNHQTVAQKTTTRTVTQANASEKHAKTHDLRNQLEDKEKENVVANRTNIKGTEKPRKQVAGESRGSQTNLTIPPLMHRDKNGQPNQSLEDSVQLGSLILSLVVQIQSSVTDKSCGVCRASWRGNYSKSQHVLTGEHIENVSKIIGDEIGCMGRKGNMTETESQYENQTTDIYQSIAQNENIHLNYIMERFRDQIQSSVRVDFCEVCRVGWRGNFGKSQHVDTRDHILNFTQVVAQEVSRIKMDFGTRSVVADLCATTWTEKIIEFLKDSRECHLCGKTFSEKGGVNHYRSKPHIKNEYRYAHCIRQEVNDLFRTVDKWHDEVEFLIASQCKGYANHIKEQALTMVSPLSCLICRTDMHPNIAWLHYSSSSHKWEMQKYCRHN